MFDQRPRSISLVDHKPTLRSRTVRLCDKHKGMRKVAAFALTLLLFVFVAPSHAQTTPPDHDTNLLGTDGVTSTVISAPAIATQPPAADSADSPLPQTAATGEDDAWHLAVSPYLWFAGVHGTASGPNGNGLGFRASPSDLLSHFRFGLLGAAEVRHKWLVASSDLLWMRLGDDKAIAFPELGATSANMTADTFLLTPKIGVRAINTEKIKVDALAGFRYWHFGERLNFNPSLLGLNFSASQNFVDPVFGGRIQTALSPKIVVNIFGDVGGSGTGTRLEYQVAGLIGYKIKPAWTLQAGYRYLNLDYSTSRGGVFNLTLAGVLFGVTWNLK